MTTGNWGRWGEDGESGALNTVGPEQVLRATGLVATGTVIPLGQPLGPRTPVSPHRKPVERFMTRDGGDYAAGARRPEGFQFAEEVISFAAHSGTHMDALAHAWYDDQLFDGHPSTSVRSTTGAQHCGADKLRPVLTRGVLLDVAVDLAPAAGDAVTAGDLAAAAERAGTAPEPGDAVLVRTGWWGRTGDASFFDGEPGLDLSAARWLAERDVACVGADNYAIEALPGPDGEGFPVHRLLIRDHGIPLIEGLVLDDLAARGATAFCFVAVPLSVVGGTAGPVNPVAVL